MRSEFINMAFSSKQNMWIRYGAVGFVAAVARTLNVADVHCNLLPLLQPFLKQPVVQVDKEVNIDHIIIAWKDNDRMAQWLRALASHQCGPCSVPGLGVICGLSLLLDLIIAPRGFSPGTLVFPFPQKPRPL